MTLRKVEVFTAGCSLCDDEVQLVQDLACPSCRVEVLVMKEEATQEKAKAYGVASVPAVAVDGALADYCQAGVIDVHVSPALGIGSPA